MNTPIKSFVVVLLGLGLTITQAQQMKKYDAKSAKIEYQLKGSGDVMGMVKIKSIGKKRLIFDNYGIKQIEEQSEVKKETTMGETKVKKTHTMTYINDAVIYKVKFKQKTINRLINPGAALGTLFGGGNPKETGEAMMIKMGGKKLGSDKVLGFTCTVWNVMGVKQCMYKGIPLKIETDVMGMKSTEIATKAEFDISLSSDDFKLPDFPIFAFNLRNPQQKPKELDRNKLEAMDAKDNAKAKVKSQEAAQAMQGISAGMAALAKSGIDINSDKELSPEQEKIMQKAMLKAMGGEGKMLARMKKQMLGKVKELDFAKGCYGHADTLKEANACVDKGNEQFNDNEDYFERWSKADKDEMLKEMAQFEKMIPCIKSAQSIETIQKCMPKEE